MLYTLALLVISMISKDANCLIFCSNISIICSPFLSKPVFFPEQFNNDFAPINFGRDLKSGCMCRKNFIYTVCYGRENCKNVPNLNITTPVLQLKATNIEVLRTKCLNGTSTNLTGLIVDNNRNLVQIQYGAFKLLTKLENLSISHNENLKKLDQAAFIGLIRLKELFLIKNGFMKIIDISPALSNLPFINKVDLSENNFPEITYQDFEPMENSTLEVLNLITCRIDYIAPLAFTPLKHLQILRLGENNFNTTVITEAIKTTVQYIQLKYLSLYMLGFRKAPPFELLEIIANSSIEILSLSRNQFDEINTKTFPLMPNLKMLVLREVSLLNITKNALKMPNLKTLVLSGNKLSSVPEGVLLPQLTYLDLQGNSEQFIAHSFSLYGAQLKLMKNLEVLNLSFNKLGALFNNSFEGLTNLRVLSLKNTSLFFMQNKTFTALENLEFLNLENNPFGKVHELPQDLFQNLKKLQVLLLGGCSISHINNSLNDLVNLKHLGLERNYLLSLNLVDFQNLPHLEAIDFSENHIKSYSNQIFAYNKKLRVINGAYNEFCRLTPAMINDFRNVTLNLINNPFHCTCTNSWKEATNIILKMQNPPFCAFPYKITNLTIKDFIRTMNCEYYDFVMVLAIISPLLILSVTSILIFYFRYHLRYWLFLIRLYLSKSRGRNRSVGYNHYQYDAFVSYSNEDRNFVIRLVTMLENYPPHIKLCVYERDFEIGTMISENILESVAKSRRTLLIISDSYAKSQWCRWESQLAEHQRLFFENSNGEYVDDSLILIKLGPVSDSHLTPTLKYLLKTRIYLLWESEEKKQRIFWEKLRKVLAPPIEFMENTHL